MYNRRYRLRYTDAEYPAPFLGGIQYTGRSANQPIQLRKPAGLLKFEFIGLESPDKDPKSEPRVKAGRFTSAPRPAREFKGWFWFK